MQFTNAFGKPIEVLTVETESELRITLRNKQHNGPKSQVPTDNPRHNENPSRLTTSSFVANDNQDRTATNGLHSNRPTGAMPNERPMATHDNYFQKVLLTIIITSCIAIITFEYCFTIDSSHPSGLYLPLSLLVTVPLVYLSHNYYKSIHRVTEETLFVYKGPRSITLSSKRVKFQEKPPIVEQNRASTGYLLHEKKYCHKEPKRQVFPLKNLTICETLNGTTIVGRIIYRLVVGPSRSFPPPEINEQKDNSLVPEDVISSQQKRTMGEEPHSLESSTDGVACCSNERADETTIFSDIFPKLDCLEYILFRINAFAEDR